MQRAIWIAAWVLLLPAAGFADDGLLGLLSDPDWVVFMLALAIAVWWAMQAFDRPAISLAGLPTFPRYMARPTQYTYAKASFVLLSIAIYSLMIHNYSDLPSIIGIVKPDWYEQLRDLINQRNPSYLVIVIVVLASFLALLRIEGRWNPLLLFREIIYSWVSIPFLTNKIVDLMQEQLVVPESARSKIEQSHNEWFVHEIDFLKNPLSMDRAWAELCYLRWWILKQRRADKETTFFSERSFAYEELNDEFENLNLIVNAHKQGLPGADNSPQGQ